MYENKYIKYKQKYLVLYYQIYGGNGQYNIFLNDEIKNNELYKFIDDQTLTIQFTILFDTNKYPNATPEEQLLLQTIFTRIKYQQDSTNSITEEDRVKYLKEIIKIIKYLIDAEYFFCLDDILDNEDIVEYYLINKKIIDHMGVLAQEAGINNREAAKRITAVSKLPINDSESKK